MDLYIGCNLDIISVTRYKVIWEGEARLFADRFTSYRCSVVVSNNDCVVLYQTGMRRLCPFKVDWRVANVVIVNWCTYVWLCIKINIVYALCYYNAFVAVSKLRPVAACMGCYPRQSEDVFVVLSSFNHLSSKAANFLILCPYCEIIFFIL